LDPDLSDSARRLRAEDLFDGSGGFAQAVTVRIAVELVGFADDARAYATLYDCYISDDPPAPGWSTGSSRVRPSPTSAMSPRLMRSPSMS
jgi:hypothetical protein